MLVSIPTLRKYNDDKIYDERVEFPDVLKRGVCTFFLTEGETLVPQ